MKYIFWIPFFTEWIKWGYGVPYWASLCYCHCSFGGVELMRLVAMLKSHVFIVLDAKNIQKIVRNMILIHSKLNSWHLKHNGTFEPIFFQISKSHTDFELYLTCLTWLIHTSLYPQNGICIQKYNFWPKNNSEKWTRKNIFEIPPCVRLLSLTS